MKSPSLRVLTLASLSAFGACADGPQVAPGDKIEIDIAPLTLDGVTDVCYGITVYNGAPASADTVWSQTGICSTQYGNGPGGGVSYVGPCDASVEGNNYVELVLESVTTTAGLLDDQVTTQDDDADFENPCTASQPCTLDFECLENADVLVEFNLTIMRDAEQGFFDVAVNFEDIFCSAKFDSCYGMTPTTVTADVPVSVMTNEGLAYRYDNRTEGVVLTCHMIWSGSRWMGGTVSDGRFNETAACEPKFDTPPGPTPPATMEFVDGNWQTYALLTTTTTTTEMQGGTPMNLLFSEDGSVRQHTAVAAMACTAGPDSGGTDLILTSPLLLCESPSGQVAFDSFDLAGAEAGNHSTSDNGYTLRYALYYGNEDLDCGTGPGSCQKAFYNIALNLGDLADQGLTDCHFFYSVTAQELGGDVVDENGALADPNGVYPTIDFMDITVIDAEGATLCTANPVNGPGSLVQTLYYHGSAFDDAGIFQGDYHTDGGPAVAY